MPKEVPHLYIVDPKGMKAVKTQNDKEQLPLTIQNNNYHLEKYEGFIFNL